MERLFGNAQETVFPDSGGTVGLFRGQEEEVLPQLEPCKLSPWGLKPSSASGEPGGNAGLLGLSTLLWSPVRAEADQGPDEQLVPRRGGVESWKAAG